MKKNDKIYIAGHTGLVGSAILKKLRSEGYKNIIVKTHLELDLKKTNQVENFFKKNKPKIVILAAAKVGGIYANSKYPADFIYENLMIQNNVIHSSFKNNVKKFIFLGSSCIYPRNAKQPILEKYLLSGELEKTNIAYAISKISGLIMCNSYNKQFNFKTDFRCLMPTNLYGPNDNYHEMNSHVIPALIKRFHEAKIKKKKYVTVWGNGKSMREFLFSEDLADATLFILKLNRKIYSKYLKNDYNIINIGTGKEYTIKSLSSIISKIVGFGGSIIFDKSKPNGTYRKNLSILILKKLGWSPKVNLHLGLKKTYRDFLSKNEL